MARSSPEIITLLRKTSDKIGTSADYQWGHMGLCNCGFLAREITHLRKEDIHTRAMQGHGDWTEQLNDYCPSSGLLMDELISAMLLVGFDVDDLKHLERLSSPLVLRALPPDKRNLRYNNKADVVFYLRIWADVLELELISDISIASLEPAVMEGGI